VQVPPYWQPGLQDGVHFVEVVKGSQEWREVIVEAQDKLQNVRIPATTLMCQAIASAKLFMDSVHWCYCSLGPVHALW
jgi:2-keto-3-deoxy-6-phosphogluconate aldolase